MVIIIISGGNDGNDCNGSDSGNGRGSSDGASIQNTCKELDCVLAGFGLGRRSYDGSTGDFDKFVPGIDNILKDELKMD